MKPVLFFCALILLLSAIAYRSYATAQAAPVISVDSIVFLPPAISFHESERLTNPVWAGAPVLDPSGQNRMIYHGFLYPMLVSLLMWRGDWIALAGVLAILHAIATLLVGPFLLNFARLWNWKLTTRCLFLILLFVAACANYTQGSLYRPEPLAAIILMLAVLCASRFSLRWHGPIMAIGIGLLGAIDPVIGVFAGLGFGAYAAWRHSASRFWLELAVAGACSLAVFALCFLWYPYSMAEWFVGTLRMSQSAFAQATGLSMWRLFLANYVYYGCSWMLAATIPLSIWCGVRFLRRRLHTQNGPASPILFFVMVSLGALVQARCILYGPWATYNWLPLMPLAFVPIFYELGRMLEIDRARVSHFQRVAFAILFLTAVGLFGDLYERAHMLRSGFNLREARERLAQWRTEHPRTLIGLDKNLFALTEDYSGIALSRSRQPPEQVELWVFAQAFTYHQQPPAFAGFQLLENHFNPNRLSLFGIPLWRTERGSGIAIYARDKSLLP